MKRYQLIVQKGGNTGEVYPLIAETLTIGRDPMCDIIFQDPEVSRQHARLTRTEWGYQVQELGSTNGTFVEGVRLQGTAVALQHQQQIMLGSNVVLIYEAEDLETMPAPTLAEPDGLAQADHDWEAQFKPPSNTASEEEEASTPIFRQQTHESEAEPAIPPEEQDEQPPFEADLWHQTARPPKEDNALPMVDTSNLPSRSYRTVTQPSPVGQDPQPEPTAPPKEEQQKRMIYGVIGCTVLMLLCCCVFLLFIYFFGGDWLLQQLGVIP